MGKTKVKLNREGVRSILRSEDVMAVCRGHAISVKNRAGDGFVTDDYVGKNRVNVMVRSGDAESYFKNLRENTLLKALGKK